VASKRPVCRVICSSWATEASSRASRGTRTVARLYQRPATRPGP
jgi:hypothetical protein